MSQSRTALEALAAAFDRLEIGFVIGGSVASSVYGAFRATVDIDIVAAIAPAQAGAFVEEIEVEFIAFEDEIVAALEAGRSFNLIHKSSITKFDIFPARTAFQRSQLRRATEIDLDLLGTVTQVPVASREDILLAKLKWFRDGGEVSDRQWSDIRGIVIAHSGALDTAYLEHWAAELDVQDLLERALR